MSLLLPTWQPGNVNDLDVEPEPSNSTTTAKAASNTKPTASEIRFVPFVLNVTRYRN